MTDDLRITDKQYLIALTVFFFPYSLFEVSKQPCIEKQPTHTRQSASEQCCAQEASSVTMALVHNAGVGHRDGKMTLLTVRSVF